LIDAQPIAQIALARRLGIAPADAAMLLHLYQCRSGQSESQLAAATGTSSGATRVHLSHIRGALGSGALPLQYSRYRLSNEVRSEVRAILADMAQEVLFFLTPLIEKDAA
jgi:hypothetical protein